MRRYNFGMSSTLESISFERLGKWGLKGGLSILDQGLYSGANFVFSVLLARWLSPFEYGAYALAYAVFLVFHQLYQSLITDPMGVLGPANYASDLRGYLLVQLTMHFATTAPFGLLIGITTLSLASLLSGDKLVFLTDLGVMGIVLPFVMLPWFLRRAFYVLHRPEVSALGSFVYAISVLAALPILRYVNLLNSYTAILAMGAAGLVSGSFLFLRLRLVKGASSRLPFSNVFRQNWNYARWLVGSASFMVLAGQMQVFMTGNILGVKAAGIIDVTQTFSYPMILMIGAITAIATPALSRDHASKNTSALQRKVMVLSLCLLGLSLLFAGMLYLFKEYLEKILYGGKFADYVHLIPLFGCVPILLSLYWGPAIGLQAAQRPQAVLIVSSVWLPVSIVCGYVFTRIWGLEGAALGTILGYAVITAICWLLYSRWIIGRTHAV